MTLRDSGEQNIIPEEIYRDFHLIDPMLYCKLVMLSFFVASHLCTTYIASHLIFFRLHLFCAFLWTLHIFLAF